MRVNVGLLSVTLLMCITLASCKTPPKEDKAAPVSERIYGQVGYLQRIALPPEAWLEVKLLRRASANAWQEVSTIIVEKPTSVPIPYQLTLRQPLAKDREYRLVATIYVNDQPWMSNERSPHVVDVTQARHDITVGRG
jgi:uncharacterized lipoprotein YbaY